MTIHNCSPTAATNVKYVDGAYTGNLQNGGESTPYTTIAAAVAASGAGDGIKIMPGTYAESLVLAAGNDLVIEAESPGSVMLVGTHVLTDASARLVGLNLTDDGASGDNVLTIAGVGADEVQLLGCTVTSTAAGGIGITLDNANKTLYALDCGFAANIANANELIRVQQGVLDLRGCDVLHGSNVREALVAEGDAATNVYCRECNFQGSVNAEAAVGAPVMRMDNCNVTVGAISAYIIAATCTVTVDGGMIDSADAAQDAIDGAGAVVFGMEPAFVGAADEVATTITCTHLLGPRMQSGIYTEAAGAGTRAIVLPQVFPSATYRVFVSYEDTGGGPYASTAECDTLATTGFNITTQGNGNWHWLAIHP